MKKITIENIHDFMSFCEVHNISIEDLVLGPLIKKVAMVQDAYEQSIGDIVDRLKYGHGEDFGRPLEHLSPKTRETLTRVVFRSIEEFLKTIKKEEAREMAAILKRLRAEERQSVKILRRELAEQKMENSAIAANIMQSIEPFYLIENLFSEYGKKVMEIIDKMHDKKRISVTNKEVSTMTISGRHIKMVMVYYKKNR